ncbi:MAG: S8 family serine peptidase [Deltaproteobacteria bacterium]|nr:S8 family serine peptidase [Deltaproteobacteria bacterium]
MRFSTNVLVLSASLVLLPLGVAAQSAPKPPPGFPKGPFVEHNLRQAKRGEILIQLTQTGWNNIVAKLQAKRPGVRPSKNRVLKRLARQFGMRISKPLSADAFKVKGVRVNRAKIARAYARGLIRSAEANFRVFAFDTTDDFFYKLGLLWNLHNTGNFMGKADVDVDAPQAWEIETGSSDLVVGVIDTGILLKHPDLMENIWRNPGESANGLDDDGNGFVDDVNGWNFVSDTANSNDDQFHGTHCAGIIGAVKGNGRGIAGVAPGVKLLPLKILDSKGEGDGANLVRAIDYAIKLKARGVNLRVLNASLGGGEHSPAIESALKRANKAGILFVAAAGNNSSDNDRTPVYPASYDLPNIISVASVDSYGKLSSFSNYGRRSVHIAAPGSSIWSSIIFNLYLPFSGTSMAAPHVTGVAALVLSKYPHLSPSKVRDRILNTVKPLEGLNGKVASPGMVSAWQAVR